MSCSRVARHGFAKATIDSSSRDDHVQWLKQPYRESVIRQPAGKRPLVTDRLWPSVASRRIGPAKSQTARKFLANRF
jgi:hypothetical protein